MHLLQPTRNIRGVMAQLEQPYDQIINSTDYLEFINAIEHGHVGLRLTAQGAVHFLLIA